MTALQADTNRKRTPILGDICRMPCKASTQFYEGGLIAVAIANGYAIPATDAAGRAFMGVAAGKPVGPSGDALVTGLTPATDGKYSIDVYISGRFIFTIASGAQTDVGKIAYIVDDATVITSTNTHGLACGIVTRYIDSTHVEVDISGFVGLTSVYINAIGAGGYKLVLAKGVFTTTGTTKTISAAGLTTIDYGFCSYDGTAALDVTKDTPLWLAGAQTVTIGSGNVTVTRASGGTSGTGFFVQLWGIN